MNSTVYSDTDTVTYVVGIAYVITGVVFIFLHIICCYLIHTDKEMRNPTYQLMINLGICDILELVGISLYAGISLIIGVQNFNFGLFMGFWVLVFWYTNCVLFVIIAFSRWIMMANSHLTNSVFRKRVLMSLHLGPYIIFFIMYSISFLVGYPHPTFVFYPAYFTWGFNHASTEGLFLEWWNLGFSTLCTTVETVFNSLTLKWVHDTRKTIMTIAARENRRRETKLLMQCFILSMVFLCSYTMYAIVFGGNLVSHPMWTLAMQIVWTANHCVNPVVYLSVNSKLRKRFVKLVFFCGKVEKVAPVGNQASSSGGMALSNGTRRTSVK